MIPVRTADTTVVYTAPDGHPEVGDLPVQVLEDGSLASVWWLDDEERAAIARGANIALVVAAQVHPVVALQVVEAVQTADEETVRSNLVELRRKADRG